MKVDRHTPAMNSQLESAQQNSKNEGKNKSRDLSASDRYKDKVEISDRYKITPEEQRRHASDVESYSPEKTMRRPIEAESQNLVTYDRHVIANNSPRPIIDDPENPNLHTIQPTDQGESPSVPTERLHEIKSRITDGYYEQSKVIQTVAGLMAEDLQK